MIETVQIKEGNPNEMMKELMQHIAETQKLRIDSVVSHWIEAVRHIPWSIHTVSITTTDTPY